MRFDPLAYFDRTWGSLQQTPALLKWDIYEFLRINPEDSLSYYRNCFTSAQEMVLVLER